MSPNEAWRDFIRHMNLPDHTGHQLFFLAGFAAGATHMLEGAGERRNAAQNEVNRTVDLLLRDQDGAIRT